MANDWNILLIWTDEQRSDTMACYGNTVVDTPHLDRLAEQSVVFDRTYCCQPLCTPSRGCILTGTWPHRHGARGNHIALNREARTLAEMIDLRYHRAYYGKWHLGDEIVAQHGFEEWISIEDAIYRPYYSKPAYLERYSDYHNFLYQNGFFPQEQTFDGGNSFSRAIAAAMPYRFTKAGFLADKASAFLKSHDDSRPFMLSVNFLEPHMPFFGPYNDRYCPDDVPTGPAFAIPPDERNAVRNRAFAAKYQQGYNGRPLKTEADWRRIRANYYGLVHQVDRAVGQIMQALEQSGLADNTVVVFTSDHGEMMGDHALLAKAVMYEPAIRVPLLIRAPGVTPHRVTGPFSQIDLVPTLLELLDVPRPDHLQGRSRREVLFGEANLTDDVFVIWNDNTMKPGDVDLPGVSRDILAAVPDQQWRTVITADGWKLNRCATDPCNELFNLFDDPHELNNRFADPDCRELIETLTERIQAWQASVGDTVEISPVSP